MFSGTPLFGGTFSANGDSSLCKAPLALLVDILISIMLSGTRLSGTFSASGKAFSSLTWPAVCFQLVVRRSRHSPV
jgi:hypothetical protein